MKIIRVLLLLLLFVGCNDNSSQKIRLDAITDTINIYQDSFYFYRDSASYYWGKTDCSKAYRFERKATRSASTQYNLMLKLERVRND